MGGGGEGCGVVGREGGREMIMKCKEFAIGDIFGVNGEPIPKMLIEYAIKLNFWFNERGIKDWQLCGIGPVKYGMGEGDSFSEALEGIKLGQKWARKGWNGKGMFIFLVPGSTFKVNRAPLLGIYPEGTEIKYHAHVDMKTSDGQIVPWLCSQTDMLANDWVIVE